MKLTAVQLGQLAIHVERVLAEHPLEPMPVEFIEMGAWEKALKKLVDSDPDLPKYDELGHEVEQFVMYFTD